jgi:hypothetical protein
MAAGTQLLFVCIFIGGIIVRVYEDIANDTRGSRELAERFLGLQSSEEAVIIMILVAFGMIALLVLTLGTETYMQFVQERLQAKWSVCTLEPPVMKWRARAIYACFLSHFKMEAASDARYMHDMLRKMLKAPVFLDSSQLSDLRNLITKGVHKSDTVLMLATQGILTRPWCLIELFEATQKQIPIVIVQMANSGFSFEQARSFVTNFEEEMADFNPSGLELLREQLGDDLTELKEACMGALNDNEQSAPVYNSHAGDTQTVAVLKDVIERMAGATRRSIVWVDSAVSRHGSGRETAIGPKRAPKRRFSASSVSLHRSSAGGEERGRRSSKSAVPKACEVVNTESAVFVCCSRRDGISHARVLRAELATNLGRGCAIGGGTDTAEFVAESAALIVLLTKQLPTDPAALFEIWIALQHDVRLIPVQISGAGYEFNEAATTYASLHKALEKQQPGAVGELQARLPKDTDAARLGKLLHASLTAIIAIPWSPLNGRNHLQAVVDDILNRVPKKQGKRRHWKAPTKTRHAMRNIVLAATHAAQTDQRADSSSV